MGLLYLPTCAGFVNGKCRKNISYTMSLEIRSIESFLSGTNGGFHHFLGCQQNAFLVDDEIAGNLLGLATLGDTVDGQFSQVVGMVEALYSFCKTIT